MGPWYRIFLLILLACCIPLEGRTEEDTRIAAALASDKRLAKDRRFDAARRPDLILSLLDVQRGMTVLDVFGGAGYYTELLSILTEDTGRVLYQSTDRYDQLLAVALRMRFADSRLPNVVRKSIRIDQLHPSENSLDRVLMVLTYHDYYFADPNGLSIDEKAVVLQMFNGLKSGGRLVIVDHNAASGRAAADAARLHRIEKATVIQDFEAAGFILLADRDDLRNPDDSHRLSVFDPAIRGKTDRFILLFQKP